MRPDEHFAALFIPKEKKKKKEKKKGTGIPPPLRTAVSTDQTSVAVIARDPWDMVVKAWRKELMLYEPIQAGAFAILWALELAVTKKFQKIIVEGDSKICIDAINGDQNDVEWSVATIINNIVSLSSSFNSCLFSWVWREANVVAHTLAKHVSSPTDFFFVCNLHSLPRSV